MYGDPNLVHKIGGRIMNTMVLVLLRSIYTSNIYSMQGDLMLKYIYHCLGLLKDAVI